jgi:hypothetical protein
MLLAVAEPFLRLAAYAARQRLGVALYMAASTEPLQVPRRVVSPILVLVMYVRPARSPTLHAWPWRAHLPRVVVGGHPPNVGTCRTRIECFRHAATPAELPAIEVDQVLEIPIRQPLPLQGVPAVLTEAKRRRLHMRWHCALPPYPSWSPRAQSCARGPRSDPASGGTPRRLGPRRSGGSRRAPCRRASGPRRLRLPHGPCRKTRWQAGALRPRAGDTDLPLAACCSWPCW